MALTAKQRLFIKAYLIDKNAAKAAIVAGYSHKAAKQAGSRLMTNVDLASAIAEGLAKQAEKHEITADKWLKRIGEFAFNPDVDHKDVKHSDNLKGCELVGKHFGWLKDVHEHKVEANVQTVDAAQVKAMREKIKSDC